MSEDRETRLRRLAMRSMRRGTREMDLILKDFSRTGLDALGDAELDDYEALLEEADQDLYRWISGAEPPPTRHAVLVARLAAGATGLTRPGGSFAV